MKKMIFLATALLWLSSCTKDKPTEPDDQLPPITMTGAMTAGCIINGQITIPKNSTTPFSGGVVYGLTGLIGPDFDPPSYNDFITTQIRNLKKRVGITYTINILMHSLLSGAGTYIVGQAANDPYVNFPFNPQICVQEYSNGIYQGRLFLSSPNSGQIKIIRFDNGVFAATFYATLYNKAYPAETILVTDGRFDTRY